MLLKPDRPFGPSSFFQLQRSGIFVEPKANSNSKPRPGAASANAFVQIELDTKENGMRRAGASRETMDSS